ncbi:hypothetical protein LMH73_016940 [Vibrio splendidus]|nr:hypothetical protein [Vibrio splendidus]MCC4881844.1 hypothetical protein [Vibrio splendidus]
MNHYETRLTSATELFNAGITSQAGKKRVNFLLGNAFDSAKNKLQATILTERSECVGTEKEADLDALYWAVPELHNWREKHYSLFAQYPEHVDMIRKLVELRAATKAADIITIEKDAGKEKIEAVRKTIVDEMARKKQQFVEGLELAKLFNGLNISVNAHYVTNEKGTEFIRHFFYMNGKLTALNMIIAIAEELEK